MESIKGLEKRCAVNRQLISSPSVLLSRLFIGIAAGIAAWLLWTQAMEGQIAGCGEQVGCEVLLKSRWSRIGGAPVSLLGLGTYLLLIVAAPIVGDRKSGPLAWVGMVAMGATVGAALWFAGIQAAVLRGVCLWCCAAHALALVGVTILWRSRFGQPSGGESMGLLGTRTALALGFAGVAAVGAVQAFGPDLRNDSLAPVPASLVQQHPMQPIVLRLLGDTEGGAMNDYPVTGSIGATKVIVAITDYRCGQCKRLHQQLKQVMNEQAATDLAVLWLPGMKDEDSGKVQRMMLALWKQNPALYAQLDEDLNLSPEEPSPAQVEALITTALGGKTVFGAMTLAHGRWADAQVARAFAIFKRAAQESGKALLPMLLVGSQVWVGSSKNTVSYHQLLEKEFGLRVPAALREAETTGSKSPRLSTAP